MPTPVSLGRTRQSVRNESLPRGSNDRRNWSVSGPPPGCAGWSVKAGDPSVFSVWLPEKTVPTGSVEQSYRLALVNESTCAYRNDPATDGKVNWLVAIVTRWAEEPSPGRPAP